MRGHVGDVDAKLGGAIAIGAERELGLAEHEARVDVDRAGDLAERLGGLRRHARPSSSRSAPLTTKAIGEFHAASPPKRATSEHAHARPRAAACGDLAACALHQLLLRGLPLLGIDQADVDAARSFALRS